MKLNKNGNLYYVIGTKYSYSTLKAMTKDRLIECLDIAQHNYECVNESEFNIKQYAKKLDKALDIACEELVDTYCQFEDETKIYFKNGKVKYACNMTKEDWKKYLLESVNEDE